MNETPEELRSLRPLLADPDGLVRAVASGTRRPGSPPWRRVELRPVDLKTGRHLQVVGYDDRQATTTNHAYGGPAEAAVDDLLAQPFGAWHVESTTGTAQARVTKKGRVLVHHKPAVRDQHTAHDRAPQHVIDPGDPLFTVLGADAGKRRQVDAFLRVLQPAVAEAGLPVDRPLRVVDLGCGNAYLTFAAYRLLAADREVRLTGVDQRPEMRERNTSLAGQLGWSGHVDFVAGDIIDAPPPGGGHVDVVLALHACDTATDDALAQAVRWGASVVLASPCCHHDLQRQLSAGGAPTPYGLIARHSILRERLGDVLTDAVRADLLRRRGYRTDVMAFVSAEFTTRNTIIRAVRTPHAPPPLPGQDDELARLLADWGVVPHLLTLLTAPTDLGAGAR